MEVSKTFTSASVGISCLLLVQGTIDQLLDELQILMRQVVVL